MPAHPTTEAVETVQGSPIETPGTDSSEEGIPELKLSQTLFYGAGGIAGGLVFTMMNNALPLFLLSYTMPAGLPAFLNPGGSVPITIVGMLSNERSLFGGLIQPLVGNLSDHTRSPIGKRSPYILAGGAGTGIALALLAIHPPFWLMIAAVTLAGVFLYVAVGPYTSLLADITPHGQRGRVGGLMALAGVLGAVFFTVLSILLWDNARGWVFALTAAGVVASLAVVALGVHEPPSLGVRGTRERETGLWKEIASHPALARYIVAMGVYWLGAGAAAPFITSFGVKELGIEESKSFTLLLVIVVSVAVGAVISGFLGDRLGKKRVMQPALAIFAIAALLGSQVRTVEQALPVMVLVGLGNAAPTALHLPLLADMVPRERAGALMGFASMIWSVAQPVGTFVAGGLVDFTHSYRWVFVLAAVCMLIAAALLHKVPFDTPQALKSGASRLSNMKME